jgi:hypothetical protein
MASWTAGWEIEFPAGTRDELLAALVVRDLVHGSTYDVETEDGSAEFEVDYEAGEELEDAVYRLLIAAEVRGPENHEMLGAFTEQMLDEVMGEADELVGASREIDSAELSDVAFDAVTEDGERWDLIVPEWLAPEGSEVPFGFRPKRVDEWWPADDDLDAYGRIVAVPFNGRMFLIALPAPPETDHA